MIEFFNSFMYLFYGFIQLVFDNYITLFVFLFLLIGVIFSTLYRLSSRGF